MQIIYLLAAAILLSSCFGTGEKEQMKNPPGYNLGKPEKFLMPGDLLEISGISIQNGALYAIQDEEGKLFSLRLGDKQANASKFGKKGDYEDVSIARGQVIVLRSDGTLFSFPLSDASQQEITSTREWNNLIPKGEYEGLYADASTGKIYVLCKNCKQDKKTTSVSVAELQLQPDGNITPEQTVSVDVQKENFSPSALAFNPGTSEWYILSSAGKMLVITDNQWKLKEKYKLDAGNFRQAEGIAFDNENNLYISNEGDKVSEGNVLKFVFNQTN